VAAFIEANNDLAIQIVANCKLTLTTIALFLPCALHKLLKFQLLDVLIFLQPSYNLIIFEKLTIIVLNNPIQICKFGLYLLLIGKSMKRRNDVFNFGVSHLLPFLLTCHHLPLLGRTCALLYTHVLVV